MMSTLAITVQLETQVSWLSLIEDNAKNGSAENISNLYDLAKDIPFKDPMPAEVKAVIDGVKKVVQDHFLDRQLHLHEKASLALRVLKERNRN
jgi:hypothetical protein